MQYTRYPRTGREGGRWGRRRSLRIPEADDQGRQALEGYAEAIERRLHEGIRALEDSATTLMDELAAEMAPTRGSGSPILRDDVTRSLLAHTDERFQGLTLRVSQMEDVLRQLAEATRDAIQRFNERSGEIEGLREDLRARAPDAGDGVALAGRLDEAMAALRRDRREDLDEVAEQLRARHIEDLGAFADRIQERLEGERSASAERSEATHRELIGRLDSVERAHRRQREEIASFSHRIHIGLGELTRRISEELRETHDQVATSNRETLDRIEAGQRTLEQLERSTGSMPAFLAEAGRELYARIETTERDLLARLDATERGIASRLGDAEGGLLSRIEAAEELLASRVHAVEGGQQRHRAELAEYVKRVHAGMTEVTTRIQEGFEAFSERTRAELDSIAERTRADLQELADRPAQAPAEVIERLERLEISGRAQREDLVAYTKRVRAGLGEIIRRVQKGFEHVAARAEGAEAELAESLAAEVRSEVQAVRKVVDTISERVGESIQSLEQRQTDSLRRVLRAAWERQAILLDESISSLQGTVKDLSRHHNGEGEDGDGAAASPDGVAISHRLRGVEHRLEQLSKELAGSLPA